MKKLLPICCLCLALSACVTSQDDFNTLQSRVLSLDAKVTAQQKALDELTTKLETGSGMRADQADLWSKVESMRSEIAQLQGNLDEVSREQSQNSGARGQDVAALEQEVQGLKAALKAQLALDLEGPAMAAKPAPGSGGAAVAGGSSVASGPVSSSAAPAEPTAPATPQDPATALYQTALATWRNGEYAQAQGLFADFLKSYPKHQLAANAHFWQGESFFQMKDYANAILRYEEVIRRYKDNPKYRAALLKEGLAFMELGKPKAGRERLRQLVKQFPDSTEAKRAQSILSR